MKVNPIAVAVPLFFVAMGLEAWAARRRGVRLYRLNDSITDLACGVSQQLCAALFGATQLAIYAGVYQFRVVELPTVWAWVVAFFGVDLIFYWWHRLSHEVNAMWAAHIVHHSSEEFNLSVALRQSVTTSWTGLPFYLPLALLGVPPLVWGVTLALSTLYQFWIHTRLVPRLSGPLDWIFNLPSHHRVHHAINPEYLDKNYGATLIIWDRLFGTFAPETSPCVYGITKPLASFRPLNAQFHHWLHLVRETGRLRGWDRLRVWFARPAFRGGGLPEEPPRPVDPQSYVKYDPPTPPSARLPIVAAFVAIVGITFFVMQWGSLLSTAGMLGVMLAVFAVLEVLGWALERPA